jgi:hypothetical protein
LQALGLFPSQCSYKQFNYPRHRTIFDPLNTDPPSPSHTAFGVVIH